MSRPPLVFLLGAALSLLSLSFIVGREIHIPVGSGRGPLMMTGLGQSLAANGIADEEVADTRRDFYFRQVEAERVDVALPLLAVGSSSLSMRFDTTVRTRVQVTAGRQQQAETFIAPGKWKESEIADGLIQSAQEFSIVLQDAPLVRRSDDANFRRYIDEFVVRSTAGFKLPWSSRIAGVFLVLFLIAMSRLLPFQAAPWFAAFAAPALLAGLSFAEPVALSLALPRLLAFALASAGLILAIAKLVAIARPMAAAVALLGVGVILGCGSLSFLPNHSPADLDIHIWRTVDLADVPMTYDAWLRYGSHYPTPSQIRGSATETLGEGPALPYSPLPYVLFYAAHAAGLDLHWSMNAIEALSLSLLLPLIFALARQSSSDQGGLLASALMALDLATIHHLGRAHSPAVVGGALGLAALLWLGLALPSIDRPGHWKTPALLLGLGALGYSSTPVFYGLCGVALMAFLLIQTETQPLFKPVLLTFCVGGVIALVLFYGHYIPGLLTGSNGTSPLADAYPGRTFFIFHNESRQSLRLWRLGLFVPMLAAVPALFVVMRRGAAGARAFLGAWVAAWAGIMLLKEPWAFPLILRWAKEDFYLAPALALLIAIGVSQIRSKPLRAALTILVLGTAVALRVNDYGFHADTLRFMR